MAEILIIDDDELFAETVTDKLIRLNHTASCVYTLHGGLAAAEKGDFDVILLDVHLPDGNGLEAIDRLKAVESEPQILIITGLGDPDGAELAIRHGAWCYLEKGSILREIKLPLTRSLQYRKAIRGDKAKLKSLDREQLIGESHSFNQCIDHLAKAANSETNVLISGESGTGKEAFARAIHANSARNKANFVVVDCTALPEQLVESVLFGHVKGAFTGAERANRGLIRHADQGTLFLDEIGELPLMMQKSFLRVLQERSFRPVGGEEEISSNFRLVCATNRDLAAMAAEGQFREDLLHRLRGMNIALPPLRDRKSDIPLLLDHFLARLSQQYGQEKKEYMPDVLEHLLHYSWPGNVRELSHAVESSYAQAEHSQVLFSQHLPLRIRTHYARLLVGEHKTAGEIDEPARGAGPIASWRQARDRFEKEYITRLLAQTDGNIMQAGRVSGLSRTRIYQLLKKYSHTT